MTLFERIKQAETKEEMASFLSQIYNMGWHDRDSQWALSFDEVVTDIADALGD